MLYVDVILPLPLADSYTYSVPPQWENAVKRGCRVVVQLGVKKMYTGVVLEVHDRKPDVEAVKPILELLDLQPIVSDSQLKFWQWVAEYYICSLGEVYKAALPSGLKLESESVVMLAEDVPDGKCEALTDRERRVLDALSEKGEEKITALGKMCGVKNILPVVNALLAKGLIVVNEALRRDYKPKTEVWVRVADGIDADKTGIVLASLTRSKSQQKAFAVLAGKGEMLRSELMEEAEVASPIVKALCDKRLAVQYVKEKGRLDGLFGDGVQENTLRPLSAAQQKAYDEVIGLWADKDVTLLHGVTSSGKTEVYIHLIKKYLSEGKQVLYLLPEIALTTQITDRLRRVFGGRMGVYHSKFSDAERVEVYQKQVSASPYSLVLGVRSSVFLPFSNLGLIIIDEEHEASYKQQDPAPRYNARSAAMVLARMYGAKTLLGTATPSFESYHNAQNGRYGYVSLTQRYNDMQLPEIEVVDIKRLRKQKRMVGALSPVLVDAMREALARKEQVILFQNRRGFSSFVECRTCGWVPRCEHCDVSLTYHKGASRLNCHYCGSTYPLPERCPNCEEEKLMHVGVGTERVEDQIKEVFPDVRTLRMDLDTARTRAAYERIIDDFAEHRADVLIGTQMVTKGLDFDNVSIVGVLDADTMLNLPDFRSYERAFHTLSQVAGRAGRKNYKGRVVLQTRSADSDIISQVVANDYTAMFSAQMEERKMFSYPPYCRLIYVYMRHRDNDVLEHLSLDMANALITVFGTERILGPAQPPVGRVQSMFIRKIIVKMEYGTSVQKVREALVCIRKRIQSLAYANGLTIYYDVDPV